MPVNAIRCHHALYSVALGNLIVSVGSDLSGGELREHIDWDGTELNDFIRHQLVRRLIDMEIKDMP